MSKGIKVGDRVVMTGNLSKDLLAMKTPRIGFVTHVDGAYIMVRPRWKKYLAEFLDNEVKPYKADKGSVWF